MISNVECVGSLFHYASSVYIIQTEDEMTLQLLEQVANCVHRLWPASLRAVPDLTDDYIYENEHKLAVPGYSQLDPYSCGATAGWAVVKTYHPKASFRTFYKNCNPLPFEGTTEGKLVRALRRNGVAVSLRSNLNYARIREAIEGGFPVITTVSYENADADHWIVIYGVGWQPRRVFLCNQVLQGWPGFGRDELSWPEFRSLWSPAGRGLVCWGKRFRR